VFYKHMLRCDKCSVVCRLLHAKVVSVTSTEGSNTHWATVTMTSGYATWFTAGGAIRIAHYDVIDDVITRKL